MSTRFCTEQAKKGQLELSKEKKHPHFAPSDGRCYSCKKNIYKPVINDENPEDIIIRGVSVQEARTQLITGCPHCNRSYCD